MNRTVTPMGATVADWLTQPLARVDAIQARQAVVQVFVQEGARIEAFREQLQKSGIWKRLPAEFRQRNARDLAALGPRWRSSRVAADVAIPGGDHSARHRRGFVTGCGAAGASLLTDLTDQLCEAPDLVECYPGRSG